MNTIQPNVWKALRLAGVKINTKGAREIAFALSWFIAQQQKILYRFDPDQNDAHTKDGLDYWTGKFDMYLHRARVLGLESPQGRQAVAEHAATAMGLLASVWRVYGSPAIQEDTMQVKVE